MDVDLEDTDETGTGRPSNLLGQPTSMDPIVAPSVNSIITTAQPINPDLYNPSLFAAPPLNRRPTNWPTNPSTSTGPIFGLPPPSPIADNSVVDLPPSTSAGFHFAGRPLVGRPTMGGLEAYNGRSSMGPIFDMTLPPPTSAGFATVSSSSSSSSPPPPPPPNSDRSRDSEGPFGKFMQYGNKLCYEKTTTYEGMVMVLNLSCNKLLDQNKEYIERIRKLEHALTLSDIMTSEMSKQMTFMKNASHNGTFIWKIPGYTQKRENARKGNPVSLYSSYFFTSRAGYKLCARLYLNGDGMGKGKYLSIFIVVMKGDNDSLLQWPFRHKVEFMLLDQGINKAEGESVKLHFKDAFFPDPKCNSFWKPSVDMNIASGCPKFVLLTDLESEHNLPRYIQDDTMFIQINVTER